MAKYKIIPSSRTIVQSPISIGHKAEKGVEAIEFDLTAWVETYGSGTLTVIMRRWGDAIPYPIALEIDENNKATWTLSDTDTAKAGMAYAQLSYIVGETVVKKSDIYTFRVMDSLTGEGDPPEAYESWLEHLTHFAAEAMAEVLDIEGIVTDKTLTVDGGIADGKATGDALALKADKSTTYTKAEVDQMIEDVTVETDTTLAVSGAPADAKATGDALGALEDQFSEETDQLKADLGAVNNQMPDVTGAILPPAFAIGSRYVQNGVDKWASNANRLSFAQGTFISLKEGDIVNKTSDVYVFGGGYTTDNGSTFTAISNTFGPYEVPEDGLYFFNLSKPNSGEWTDTDIPKGREYITFFRAGSLKDSVTALENDTSVANIKEAIGYKIGIIEPTEFYTMPYEGKGLNASGVLTDDALQDTSDYIELTDFFYGVARVTNSASKYGLGSICYYTSEKVFIKRVQPGTTYDFVIFNGEKVAWLPVDKTVANAKYIRFCARNDYGFRYWIVYNGYKAGVLDQYKALPLYGKKIVNFGDSIFGNTRPPKDISTYLAELTGATVYNCGFGGCEMSTHANANYTPFSMCSLADAVAAGTWTTQETNAVLSGMPSYFAETVALLKGLDFSDIDIVTIAYGTNDWNNGSPLDNGGKADMAYFADALRYSIETLLTAYPNLRIFVCTQTYRFFMDSSYAFVDDCRTHTNSHEKTLTDFVNKTIEVAEEYNLPCINNYNIGMNKYSRSQYFSATDGTHPTYVGNQLIAHHIAKELF